MRICVSNKFPSDSDAAIQVPQEPLEADHICLVLLYSACAVTGTVLGIYMLTELQKQAEK